MTDEERTFAAALKDMPIASELFQRAFEAFDRARVACSEDAETDESGSFLQKCAEALDRFTALEDFTELARFLGPCKVSDVFGGLSPATYDPALSEPCDAGIRAFSQPHIRECDPCRNELAGAMATETLLKKHLRPETLQ